ncbi:DUF7521 family protein [Haladaptatus sp. SPP-AMP-3]|uniref:DUF7521 family protein n=1 Tax=Haladaptatus sp. SPP-AMP-3 TaxID=3121295 RepID=UPI003C2B9D8F
MGLGLLIAYQGFRGYRRNHSEPMLFVAIGFIFLTIGGTMGCSLIQSLQISATTFGAVQTVLVAMGMGCVLYSLYG